MPVLDTGARGSTTTFAQRGVGDVLLAWENEAFLAIDELGPDKFEIIVPSLSINAEPPVAVVDKVVDAKGTRKVAEAYLNFLYTPEAQKLIAKHYYRPSDPKSADPKDLKRFADLKLVSIDDPVWAAGPKRSPSTSATGAFSTRSISQSPPIRGKRMANARGLASKLPSATHTPGLRSAPIFLRSGEFSSKRRGS